MKNIGENACPILYIINLFEKYEYKKIHQQNSFIFRYFVWIPNFDQLDDLGKKFKIFNIPIPFKKPLAEKEHPLNVLWS